MKKIIIAILFVVGSLCAVFFYFVRPVFKKDVSPKIVSIPYGSSLAEIANILHQKNVIRSSGFFYILSKMSGKSKLFKAGTYLFGEGHYWEIVSKLADGNTYKIRVTFPEGWTSYQVAERLKSTGLISDVESFVNYVQENFLEGYLFPETYFFEIGADIKEIAKSMQEQFHRKFTAEFQSRAKELKMSEHQITTLASIIEREAKTDSDRVLVSSVFHNRLKRRWLLEACPTVQYALSGGKFWKENLTFKDLKINSPYNTYIHLGLPPAPICNPGLTAIRSALYPAQTNLFFFIADGKGSHHFFSRYSDHLQKYSEKRTKSKKLN